MQAKDIRPLRKTVLRQCEDDGIPTMHGCNGSFQLRGDLLVRCAYRLQVHRHDAIHVIQVRIYIAPPRDVLVDPHHERAPCC